MVVVGGPPVEFTMAEGRENSRNTQPGAPEAPGASVDQTAPTPSPARTPEPLLQERGKTVISEGIVAAIAALAVRKTDGVRRVVPISPARSLLDRLLGTKGSAEHQGSDVSVTMHSAEVTVGVRIVVEYGRSLPEVSDAVRKAVIRDVESLTGMGVKAVDVEISDLAFEPSADAPRGEPP